MAVPTQEMKKQTTDSTPDTLIPRRWHTVVRVIWLVLAFLLIAISVAGIPAYFNELRVACLGEACHVLALSPQETGVLRDFGLSLEFYAGYNVIVLEIVLVGTMALLAGLIFWRKSDDWMAVMVSVTLLLFGFNFLSEADSSLVRLYPGLHPAHNILTSLATVTLVLLFYLFPNGRFVPGWTRFAAIILAGTALIDPVLKAGGSRTPSGQISILLVIVLLGCLVVGAFAQIYRYRRVSTPSQRQQTKWVVFGLTSLIIPTFVWFLLVELFPPFEPGPARLTFNTIGFGILVPVILAFPVSVVFSILRYRLWDIDIVINRVLVYGLLSGTLALVYFGSVVLLESLFRVFTGQGSQLTIVASTLAIAALFSPLRRRIQDIIDHRFYRRKYDAEQVLAQFVATTVRDEVDLDNLAESLLTVVKETMLPAHVSLWLAEPQRRAST